MLEDPTENMFTIRFWKEHTSSISIHTYSCLCETVASECRTSPPQVVKPIVEVQTAAFFDESSKFRQNRKCWWGK